jgi:predicted transglutaminase-like cysteine proteinase
LFILAIVCASLGACAHTTTFIHNDFSNKIAGSRPMRLGAQVEPPWGFVALCSRSPIDCVDDDTPQARARAVLAARAIAAERWRRALQSAARHQPPAPPEAAAAIDEAPAADARGARDEPAAAPPDAPAATAQPGDDARDGLSLAVLRRVNAYVNAAIIPARDEQVYGVRDWWTAPLSSGGTPYGDCKDYALEKRRELIALGAPASALSIALVRTRRGELHAVLVATTRRGDVVLDNLTSRIRAWDATDYRWQARQSAKDPMVWLSVRE